MSFSCLEHSDAFVLFSGLNPELFNKLIRPHITRSKHADLESSLISLIEVLCCFWTPRQIVCPARNLSPAICVLSITFAGKPPLTAP